MAKISFNKLKCKINDEIKVIDFNGEKIEVKQYLPVQEKLGLIGRVVMLSHEEDANYSNPVKSDVFTDLEIVFAYTNISFTEKQKEDLPKLYDSLLSSGLLDLIFENIPAVELIIINDGVKESIEAIYKYQNSILGIMDSLRNNYSDLENIDIEGMHNSLNELAETPLIKELMPLLGLQ